MDQRRNVSDVLAGHYLMLQRLLTLQTPISKLSSGTLVCSPCSPCPWVLEVDVTHVKMLER